MKYAELTPEEKLYGAIFGELAWQEEVHHWLSDDGRKAINDLLDDFVAKPHHGLTKAWCERAVKILRLRFGFEPRDKTKRGGTSNSYTLEEVGHCFNLSRERIRQIEARTLRRLRYPVYTRDLKQYLEGRF